MNGILHLVLQFHTVRKLATEGLEKKKKDDQICLIYNSGKCNLKASFINLSLVNSCQFQTSNFKALS